MTEPAKRSIFRWVHIVCGIPILGYIYDSPSDTHNYAFSVRYVFLPVLLLSGLGCGKAMSFDDCFEAIGLTTDWSEPHENETRMRGIEI